MKNRNVHPHSAVITARSLIRGALAAALSTSIAGCLGADSVSSDDGRYPKLAFRQTVFLLGMSKSSSRVVSLDVERYNYFQPIRLHADSVPPGVTVTINPDELRFGMGGSNSLTSSTSMFVTTDASVPSGDHKIVIRASGVVVRSARTQFVVRIP